MSSLNALHAILRRMGPETAHGAAIRGLRLAQATGLPLRLLRKGRTVSDSRLQVALWGRRFANPVGLAAGFDKNGQAIRGLAALGFGFLELGTVTPLPQRGNPKPRLFRYPAEQSLENALGFNNAGVVAVRRSLRRQFPFPLPVGINVGKNRATALEDASRDYQRLVEELEELGDYFVINISSPNTPELRDLQQRRAMLELLACCRQRTSKPVLVKLAPDLEDARAVELSAAAVEGGAAGIVLTNTTVDYALLSNAKRRGGLSGRVLRRRSVEMLRLVAGELAGRSTLISVGGIDSPEEAYARLRAGATLVQIYTAMVFQGPDLIARVARGLIELLERDGISSVQEAIGADLT